MSKPNFSIRKKTEIWPMRCFRGGCTCWFQSTDHQQRLNVPNAMGTSTSPTFYLLIPHTSTHTNCKTRKGTGTFRERDWGFQVRGLGKDMGGGADGSVGCCLALISLHLSGAAGIVTVVPSSPLLSPPRQDRLSRSKDWQMATAAKPHHHHHPCSPSATLSSCRYPPIILMSPPLPYIHTGGRVGRGKEGKEEWRNVWRIRF